MEGMVAALYREEATYLQVLRENLLRYIQRALLHFLTQIVPDRYIALNEVEVEFFEEQIRSISNRCIPLLTIEQLVILAEEARINGLKTEKQIVEHIEGPDNVAKTKDDTPISLSLSLSPPLDSHFFQREWNEEIKFNYENSNNIKGLDDISFPSLTNSTQLSEPNQKDIQTDSTSEKDPQTSLESQDTIFTSAGFGDLRALRKLIDVASANWEEKPLQVSTDLPGKEIKDHLLVTHPSILPESQSEYSTLLSRDPKQLLEWSKAIDIALRARLINLSYGINTILIDYGLITIDTSKETLRMIIEYAVEERAPVIPNLFRLKLPLDPTITGGKHDQTGLLLRCDDLESIDLRLVYSRRSLTRRQHTLQRLAKQKRYWKDRILTIEAEKRWFRQRNNNSTETQR
uniref:Uncharacterized protein n=1 Tax=Paulinella chromatophora TaxID=39717 RepID=B1X439_PAUCH|nr:hypothetical protein PCC_0259 [Paulinella chromatophora]ACB42708.1 hypothetical protein PCC_0259 [Paulinella chromatophora]